MTQKKLQGVVEATGGAGYARQLQPSAENRSRHIQLFLARLLI
jgi:hypothetical protein